MSPVLAGLITIAVVTVCVYLGFSKLQLPFGSHYEVQAVFRTAATEIKGGSPVRIAGVDVGKVVGVESGPGGTALATLRIEDRGRPLHRDATFKIRPRLFLEGNFFVDAEPGTPSAGELEDGGTVPIGQTAVAVQLDEVLRTLQRDTRDDLQATVSNLARVFDEGGAEAVNRGIEHWDGAFSGTALSAEAARGARPGDLSRFVDRQADVSKALADRDRELADLVTGFATTVTALADRRDDLGATLRAARDTMAEARPGLAELRATVPALRRFTAAVRPALRVAPETIDEALPFVRDATKLFGEDELLALTGDLRPAIASLRTVTPQLQDLLARLTPVLTCVSRSVIPTLNKSVEDGIHTTGMPIWQEFLHIGPGLAMASAGFDANGNDIRYLVGGGENLVSTSLPGLSDLYSLTEQPLLGARPAWNQGKVPPLEPTVPCETQDLPDLRAEGLPAPAAQRRVSMPLSKTARSITQGIRKLQSFDGTADLERALRAAAKRDRRNAR